MTVDLAWDNFLEPDEEILWSGKPGGQIIFSDALSFLTRNVLPTTIISSERLKCIQHCSRVNLMSIMQASFVSWVRSSLENSIKDSNAARFGTPWH